MFIVAAARHSEPFAKKVVGNVMTSAALPGADRSQSWPKGGNLSKCSRPGAEG